MINKRWYDSDPILKEALELLRLQPDETKTEAAEFMLKLQEQVAAEVIDHVLRYYQHIPRKRKPLVRQRPYVNKRG